MKKVITLKHTIFKLPANVSFFFRLINSANSLSSVCEWILTIKIIIVLLPFVKANSKVL